MKFKYLAFFLLLLFTKSLREKTQNQLELENNNNNKIKTVNDQTCKIPFTYNNQVHNECLFSQEFKKSWCFTESDQSQWNFCQQEEEQQKKQLLIKNLQEDMKTNLCLSSEDKEVNAIDCSELLKSWRRLVWRWQSPGLIIYQESNRHVCIRNEQVKLCEASENMNDEFYLDEYGKIINTKTSDCILIRHSSHLQQSPNIVYSQRCLDKSFQGQEIFQINEFNEKQLENYELQSEIEEWKEGHSLVKNMIQENKQLKNKLDEYGQKKNMLWERVKEQKEEIQELGSRLEEEQKEEKEGKKKESGKIEKGVRVQYYDDIAFSKEKCVFMMEKMWLNQERLKQESEERVKEESEERVKEEECLQMGESQMGIRMSSVLLVEETSRFRFRISYQGGGVRFQLDNKLLLDSWTVQDNIKEIITEDIVLFNQHGYQLWVDYFSIDPVQTQVKVEYLIVDSQQTYSILDKHVLTSEDVIRCEP